MLRVLSRDTVRTRINRVEQGSNSNHADYDVSRDGRILMPAANGSGLRLVVVPNWRDELREKMKQAAKAPK